MGLERAARTLRLAASRWVLEEWTSMYGVSARRGRSRVIGLRAHWAQGLRRLALSRQASAERRGQSMT